MSQCHASYVINVYLLFDVQSLQLWEELVLVLLIHQYLLIASIDDIPFEFLLVRCGLLRQYLFDLVLQLASDVVFLADFNRKL